VGTIPFAVAVQGDGRLLVGGIFPRYDSLVRYNLDGSVDTSFEIGVGVQLDRSDP
jgi:hypothetical protein